MTLRSALAAATIALIATGAAAQDFNAMNDAFNAQLNGAMNSGLNNIIQTNVNDPRIQQMYQQAMASGQFYGSLADYAYAYAYTGGFTPQGYSNAIGTNNQLVQDHNQMMGDYWASQQVYRDAYGNLVNGHAANQWEGGLGLMGQNTYNSPYGAQQLPHTWQPGSYDYNGNSYIVDNTGQYYMADPYGSGYYAPMW